MSKPRLAILGSVLAVAIGLMALWPTSPSTSRDLFLSVCEDDVQFDDAGAEMEPVTECKMKALTMSSPTPDATVEGFAYSHCYLAFMATCDAGNCEEVADRRCRKAQTRYTATVVDWSDEFVTTWDAGQIRLRSIGDLRPARGRCACRPLVDPDAGQPCRWWPPVAGLIAQPGADAAIPAPRGRTLDPDRWLGGDCVKKLCAESSALGEPGYSMPPECGGPP